MRDMSCGNKTTRIYPVARVDVMGHYRIRESNNASRAHCNVPVGGHIACNGEL